MEFADHRFTVSEVAALTETNLGTIQAWRRKGYFTLEESGGWHRFTFPELFSIAVFAEVNTVCRDQGFASSAAYLADQMLAEVIANAAAPYVVGVPGGDSEPVLEVTYGARDVGRILDALISSGADAGAFVVVDYAAIFHRLQRRLQGQGYAAKPSGSAA